MAGGEREQDLTEQATPQKLREARRRGQVSKSMETTAWIIMLAATAFIAVFGMRLIEETLSYSSALFSQVGHIPLSVHNALLLFSSTVLHVAGQFGFLIVTLLVFSILATLVQTGFVFSWTPLQPDFNRLNPAAGLKRIFNKRLLFECVKITLKLGLGGLVVVLFLRQELPVLLNLAQAQTKAQLSTLMQMATTLVFWLLGVLAVVALIDLLFAKWEFTRNMRMSRRELKEEYKRQEGDPKIKAKIRELQRELVKRGNSLPRVADADVLITNPTHLSVALLYRRGEMPAPLVIAKGAGEMALHMRLKARQCGVPVVENKPLARKLFERVQIDEPVLAETYAAVAKILTRVYQTREGRV